MSHPPPPPTAAAAPPACLARKTTGSRAKNARIRARYNPSVMPSPRQSPCCDPPTSIKYSMISTISASIHPTGFSCVLHQPSRHYVRFFSTASGHLSSVVMAHEMPMCGTSRRAVGPTTVLAWIIGALAAPCPIDVAPPSPSAAAATTAQSAYAWPTHVLLLTPYHHSRLSKPVKLDVGPTRPTRATDRARVAALDYTVPSNHSRSCGPINPPLRPFQARMLNCKLNVYEFVPQHKIPMGSATVCEPPPSSPQNRTSVTQNCRRRRCHHCRR